MSIQRCMGDNKSQRVNRLCRSGARRCLRMKQASIALLLVLILFISIAFAGHYFSRDYREAESLVQLIWPLAREMKNYVSEQGELPSSIEELTRFSRRDGSLDEYDFSFLSNYDHHFPASGERLFFLRVNDRYAFAVDDHYRPSWVLSRDAGQAEALEP